MEKFKQDIFPGVLLNTFVLPNYPPREWGRLPKERFSDPLRVIYVGALSVHTMYVKEFSKWITQQNGRVVWDIYSYNYDVDTKRYLTELQSPWISVRDGVDYSKLPNILVTYDVGVVLYKGHIPNYVYNAPNKLFEYLACGLDVWFPNIMTGSLLYCSHKSYPKVIALDFNALNKFDLSDAAKRAGHTLRQTQYFADDALVALINKLVKND